MDMKVDVNTVIVFDLDDTLYNELDYLISACKFIACKVDPENSEELFSLMLSLYKNKQDVFKYLEAKYSIELLKLLTYYRDHFPDIKLFPDVLELFQSIKNNAGKLALLTDGRSVTQRNKIKSLGLENIFDYISISEEIGFEKPSLQGFKLIEKKFNSIDYIYIGDNLLKDFIAPKKLKWGTICLIDNGKNIHSNHNTELKTENKPDFFIHSFKELKVFK
jgi:putative hydrolase of the HAD superfamily